MKRTIVESMSMEEAFRALNKKPQRKVVESIDTGRTFAQIANVVPFKDFISGKSMIYFLQDFAGSTGELYIVAYNGDVYGLDTGNEIADYICGTHEITSYDDLAEFANYSLDDIDIKLYGEKNIPATSFNYDGLNIEEFINRFEFEPPRVTDDDNVDEGYLAYYGKDDSDTKAPQWWLNKGGTDASWREQQRINNSGKHDEETGKYIWGNQRVRESADVEEELAEEGYIAHYGYDGSEKKAPQWWLDKGGTDASWREQQRINNSGKHDEETGRYIFGSERRN